MSHGLKRVLYTLGGTVGGVVSSTAFLKGMTYYKLASMETAGYVLGIVALAVGSSVLAHEMYKRHRGRYGETYSLDA